MISIEIGKLTESIREVVSGVRYNTEVTRARVADIRRLTGTWAFDWQQELAEREVYKLVSLEIGPTIQGLMSLEYMSDHIYVNLLESHPQNVGRNKKYEGGPGNLMAYAARLSLSFGFGGALCFDAKSELIKHYEKVFGARRIGNAQRMVIEEPQAKQLIEQYYGG